MAEWTLKYADARGEIHQQVAQAGCPAGWAVAVGAEWGESDGTADTTGAITTTAARAEPVRNRLRRDIA